jgi:hypothetical protein
VDAKNAVPRAASSHHNFPQHQLCQPTATAFRILELLFQFLQSPLKSAFGFNWVDSCVEVLWKGQVAPRVGTVMRGRSDERYS